MSKVGPLDDLVALILKARSHTEITKELVPALKKADKSSSTKATVFEGKLQDGSDPLKALNPNEASVGYLFILNARCSANHADINLLLPYIATFALTFDPEQLRLVPEQVLFFAKTVVNLAEQAKNTGLSIEPLKNLIQRYAPPGVLTAIHPLFLQVILTTRAYLHAAEIINVPIIDVDPSTYPIKYHDHLLYHYLGGSIAAILKDNIRAIDMLETCISAPGTAVAAVQIDAYKKLVLVQLLAGGKLVSLPQYTSNTVITSCKSASGPYIDYALAYASHDKQKLHQLQEKFHDVFLKDHNLGLIFYCERAFRRRTIQRLTETYITLSLVDIATAVELPLDDSGFREAEHEVLRMLTDGEVHGSISHPAGVEWVSVTVTFTDDPEPYNSHATVARVTRAIEQASRLDRTLLDKDWAVGRSKDFVQKAYNSSAGGGAGMALGGDEDTPMGRFDWDGDDA